MRRLFWLAAFSGFLAWIWSDLQSLFDSVAPPEPPVLPGRLVQEGSERTSFRPRFIPPSMSPNQRTDATMLRTMELAVGNTWQTSVQVLSGRHQLALGTIVSPDGWIATKASQLGDSPLEIKFFDGKKLPAKNVRSDNELDLALLKVERTGLPSLPLDPIPLPRVGAWLATTTTVKTPIGIGVVSVGPRRIAPTQAVLGVQLSDSDDGALVDAVIPGGGAYRAGIEEGDLIVSMDGNYLPSKDALIDRIRGLQAGQRVSLKIKRNESVLDVTAQLMDLTMNPFDPTEMEVNGNVSARSTGFQRVFQHDTVLAPHQCGGPVIDSHGKIVGLNIARAGRVNTYAIPLDVLVPAVKSLMANPVAIPVATPTLSQ